MKELIYRIAKGLGLFALCRWITRNDLRILAYHGIWLGPAHFGNFLYMSPDKFAARMQKLSSMGLPVFELGEALRRRNAGTLPHTAVVITIDDGWYGTYRHMLPCLERLKFPATVYVTTYYSQKSWPVLDVAVQYLISATSSPSLDPSIFGLKTKGLLPLKTLDERQYALKSITTHMNRLPGEAARQKLFRLLCRELGFDYSQILDEKWFSLVDNKQVADMAERGFDIQLHTHRHRISVDGASCIDQEISDNRTSLQSLVDRPLRHFCYPSGLYDESVFPELEMQGIKSATTTEPGLVSDITHRFAMPRILDGEQVSDIEFEAEMAGFCEVKRRISAWLR